MSRFLSFPALALLATLHSPDSRACTNFLVTPGASEDGSAMVTYAADSHTLYGELYYRPSGSHQPGATVEVREWDTGKLLGRIPQVPETYAVVGLQNEHQLVIGETTFGGRKELKNDEGLIDYGSLMFLALQRAKTAREAISLMGELVARHGYYSSGETFSIADPKEVWIMGMIGKGPGARGAVWVARRLPDGYVSAHANHVRIGRFPLDDPENCMYSPDVIDFARKKGYFDGRDVDFHFADAYAPMTWRDWRIREARVWSFFRSVAPSMGLCVDVEGGRAKECSTGRPIDELPLWVKPDRKLSVRDLMGLMRDHFEGTPLDLSKGVGAGPYGLPYRWRPLIWETGGHKYMNDRSTATQQTGFSFVAQARSWLPDPIGGVSWFGVDDAASTVYVPMYCGIRGAPRPFAVGGGDFDHFSWDSAFWVFNAVSNLAYTRYRDMIRDIRKEQEALESEFVSRQPQVEKEAAAIHAKSPEKARAYLTKYGADQSARVMGRWRGLWERLFVKYLDGNVRNADGKVEHPGYGEGWYERISKEDGELYLMRRRPGEPVDEEGH